MAIRFRYQNLTEGPILKKLIAFAVPMMVGNLLQQVYNLTDTIIVGRAVGREALAAVGASYSLMTFLTSVMIGLCMGCSACMAMSYGADRPEEMREKIWASFWMIGGVTAAIIITVYAFEIPILHILRVPEDTFELMREYLKIIFGGIVFTFLYNYFAFLLRAVGNSVIPLLYLGSASILNIFLDIRLVLGAGLGVKGAAIAT
ncbi:MAG: oligosaccharide flippase family protein, partial [Clostridiales bacterium]|nr:oligosaccharide flippase family protein [Candidatus Blautia equi]